LYSSSKKRSNNSLLVRPLGIASVLVLILMLSSNLALVPIANGKSHSLGLGNRLNIPKDLITPPNQDFPLPSNAISGSDIPKNTIVGPSCVSGCPEIIGTNRDDIIYGVPVTDVTIFSLKGDDYIIGGSGNTKLYGGDGNDNINGGFGNAQMYGGEGDDVMIGGSGNNILIGGPGNDQLYSGTATDTLIGGPGADFFNCGSQTSTGGAPSSAVILDFNPGEGDSKSTNCKYVFTQGGAPATP
jgi:Ca2+-binding RTX toxin-like protein